MASSVAAAASLDAGGHARTTGADASSNGLRFLFRLHPLLLLRLPPPVCSGTLAAVHSVADKNVLECCRVREALPMPLTPPLAAGTNPCTTAGNSHEARRSDDNGRNRGRRLLFPTPPAQLFTLAHRAREMQLFPLGGVRVLVSMRSSLLLLVDVIVVRPPAETLAAKPGREGTMLAAAAARGTQSEGIYCYGMRLDRGGGRGWETAVHCSITAVVLLCSSTVVGSRALQYL